LQHFNSILHFVTFVNNRKYIATRRQFAEKPTRGQSSRGLINSRLVNSLKHSIYYL